MNIFKQLFISLYSPRDISKFRFQGIGKTILFVFFLTLLSVLPSIFYISTGINNGVEAAKQAITNELPEFQIENGLLKTAEKETITVTINDFTIFFDSTGSLDEGHLDQATNAIALLKNDFYFIAGGEVTSYPYSILGEETLSKQDISDFLTAIDSMLVIFIPILALVIYLFSAGVKFIEISILALIGLMLKNLAKRKLQYRQLWRMAAYSVTLPTVFFTIMTALKTTVPSGFIINWFVAGTMLYLSIKEVPKLKE